MSTTIKSRVDAVNELLVVQRLLTRTKRYIADTRNKEDKLIEELNSDLDYICRTVIDDFYSDYMPNKRTGVDPVYYNRTYDLYNVYKINVDLDKWEVEFSPSFMHFNHHQGNDYVYEIAFVQGYHGGSYGKDTPIPRTPYYRGPYPEYTNWTTPAKRSLSPKEQMEDLTQECMDTAFEKFEKLLHRESVLTEHLTKRINEAVHKIERAIMKGGVL